MLGRHYAAQQLYKTAKGALRKKEIAQQERSYCEAFEANLESLINLPESDFNELMEYYLELAEKHYSVAEKNQAYKKIKALNRKVSSLERREQQSKSPSTPSKKQQGPFWQICLFCIVFAIVCAYMAFTSMNWKEGYAFELFGGFTIVFVIMPFVYYFRFYR